MFIKKILLFIALILFPHPCFAFEVSPSVVDISFSQSTEVLQDFFVINTDNVQKIYEAEVKLVTFAPNGSISALSDIPESLEANVSPRTALVDAGVKQQFIITFLHPEKVTADQVFAVALYERGDVDTEVSGGFVTLLFPTDVVPEAQPSFRIDAFTVIPTDGGFRGIMQLTNTGDALVKPISVIFVHDMFGREIGRFVFADHEGRLPVGTTRVISDVLPFADFGLWHVGGRVTFDLDSVAVQGGEAQYASITLGTMPGKGVLFLAGGIVLLLVGVVVFFIKKRGILRS